MAMVTVSLFSNPDSTQEGLRVPLIIVSPYAIRGHTDTTTTTFAGIRRHHRPPACACVVP